VKPLAKLLLQIVLLPFGLLYGLVMELRNRFYDRGIFKSRKFAVPVISVGNLTVGGSGKTPFTIFLARSLQKHFTRIAVVSRGYRRKSTGLQLVSDGENIILGPQKAGDEPYLMARRLPGVFIAVSEKRSTAIAFLQKNYAPDLVILDDAFQHRSVMRDVDILLLDFSQTPRRNFPFPAGTLREFPHNRQRAHITVGTNLKRQDPLQKIPAVDFFSFSVLGGLRDLYFRPAGKLSDWFGKEVTAFAGIAHPENFRQALVQAGVKVTYFKSFRDHYAFTRQDIRELIEQGAGRGCHAILCTEKDLVKLQMLFTEAESKTLPIYGVELILKITKPRQLLQKILTRLKQEE